MSDLTDKIRRAQVEAGERVVIDDLKAKGLLDSPIKIFNMDDCTWVSARYIDDAWKAFASFVGNDSVESVREDYPDTEPEKLSEADLDRLSFTDDFDDPSPETTRTFREQLAAMIEADPNQFPCFFATTEY